MQTPLGNPMRDCLLTEPKLKQLAPRNDAVLPPDQTPKGDRGRLAVPDGGRRCRKTSGWLKTFTFHKG
jgi:hypothetical protein